MYLSLCIGAVFRFSEIRIRNIRNNIEYSIVLQLDGYFSLFNIIILDMEAERKINR